MDSERRRVGRKTPMVHRICGVVALLLVLAGMPAMGIAQSAVAVDDAVRAALMRHEQVGRLEAQIRAARAQLDDETVAPLPTVSLDHAQIVGDRSERGTETSVWVEQRFDPSRWRSTYRESLSHRVAALEAETDALLLETATTVRLAFFAVVYHEARLQALDAWVAQLTAGLQAMRVREASGDLSTFEVRRFAREVELATAQRAADASALAAAWAELVQWTAWETRPQLVGDLLPPAPAASSNVQLPDLARLEHLARGLAAERNALDPSLWRDWSAGLGYQYANVGQGVGHGLLLTLSIPLAYRDTNAPRRDQLHAQLDVVEAELVLGRHRAERASAAAVERLDATLTALAALLDGSDDAALTQLAQLGFDAGEVTLPELLDAIESELELQLTRLELQWEARRAAIAVDRSRGLGVPQ